MYSQEGYSFSQLKLALMFIETLTHVSLKMSELCFEKSVFSRFFLDNFADFQGKSTRKSWISRYFTYKVAAEPPESR